jgi:hypothetical protein
MCAALCAGALLLSGSVYADATAGAAKEAAYMYDEAAYTEYVEATMRKLDKLYLQFCEACGADVEKSWAAKKEFLVTVRDLMQYMNGKFDNLDPKAGASLSATETMVSIHALTMLVDILAETQLTEMTVDRHLE